MKIENKANTRSYVALVWVTLLRLSQRVIQGPGSLLTLPQCEL